MTADPKADGDPVVADPRGPKLTARRVAFLIVVAIAGTGIILGLYAAGPRGTLIFMVGCMMLVVIAGLGLATSMMKARDSRVWDWVELLLWTAEGILGVLTLWAIYR